MIGCKTYGCTITVKAGGHLSSFYLLDRKAEEQNKFIERVDVLNKVKELFLMPTMEMMSIQMVQNSMKLLYHYQ